MNANVSYETALPGSWAQGFVTLPEAEDYARERSSRSGGHVIEVRVWAWDGTARGCGRGSYIIYSRYAAGTRLIYNGFKEPSIR